jgi:hypothetical protein
MASSRPIDRAFWKMNSFGFQYRRETSANRSVPEM